MTRYVLYPAIVFSKNDGDRHFIGIGQLLFLYRIPRDARWVNGRSLGYREQPGDIHCRPRFHGDYPVFQ